jgi:hypothetical protein
MKIAGNIMHNFFAIKNKIIIFNKKRNLTFINHIQNEYHEHPFVC